MKVTGILFSCAAIALPQFARADLPFNGQALGLMQSTLDFCAQLYPEATPRYIEEARFLVQSVSEKEVADIRSTYEYKTAYDSATAALGKASQRDTVKVCNSFLAADN